MLEEDKLTPRLIPGESSTLGFSKGYKADYNTVSIQ